MFDAVADWTLLSLFGSEERLISLAGGETRNKFKKFAQSHSHYIRGLSNMKTKHAVWLAFFLNLSFAIVEFIAGGIFGSSAVLADSVHDFGDAVAMVSRLF